MNNALLKDEVMSFPPVFLKRWRNGDYSPLTSADIPSYIKQIIVQKEIWPGGRFFGEASESLACILRAKSGQRQKNIRHGYNKGYDIMVEELDFIAKP